MQLGREFALVVAALGAVTGLGLALYPGLSPLSVGLLYLLAIIGLSLRTGRGPMLAAGISSALLWDFFFVPPRFALRIDTVQDTMMVAIYLVVAVVAGQAAARIREQARRERMAAESERLHRTVLESISHELRTPLAVIGAGLDNLGLVDAARAEQLVAEMRTAARRLNRQVGALLDQSRLETGTLRPWLDWCDPNDLARAAVDAAGDALADHALNIAIPADMPPIRADFGLTETALANLLLNAGVHTPAGTAVSLEAGRTSDGARVFLRVSDSGPGLPAALRQRLFEKFERGGQGRTRGLGLGLSIARGFVAAQGGELVAEEPKGGAAFAIYLPHSDPQPDSG